MRTTKEPKFRVVKREARPAWKNILLYSAMILVSLIIGSLLLLTLKINPFVFFKDVFTIGMIGNRFAYKSVEGYVSTFVPLLITSVALTLSFRMRFWNIGGEGQFIMGALASGTVAMLIGGKMSVWIVLPLMLLAGMLVAGVYGAFVALLKVKHGTNETLLTLMLNYIALYIIKFFGESKGDWNFYLDSNSARPTFAAFGEGAWMPGIRIGNFTLNISLIFAIVICVGVYIYLKNTKQGYEIAVVGDSAGTANYAGMKVNKIVVRTMFISACLIGFAGTCYVSTQHILSTSVTNNVGWTGIIVAWLSKLNIIGVFITSMLITVLRYGCTTAGAQFSSIDSNFADLLQGIILFSVLIADFMIRFKIVRNKVGEEDKNE